MPSQEELHKFKMAALGYDPSQEALMKRLAEEKAKQQIQQPQVPVPVIQQSQNTGMPNLNMDAARDTFFTNLKKLLGQN